MIFDCDGLLVTTESAWDAAYRELFTRYGCEVGPYDRDRLRGLDLVGVGHVLSELLPTGVPPDVLGAEALALMRGRLDEVIAPMPGAVELVTELTGTRPLGVASNAPADVVRAHLSRFFDVTGLVIVGGDMVRAPKPRPDVYLAACEALHADPEQTWALEDSAVGVAAASAAGLYVVGVPHHADEPLLCDLQVESLEDPRLRGALLPG
ncbi:HAD family hydrolase [Streptomyces tsukubensis]|uniref:HAD family hydrolase n=1 Tax=Streptomyces tsukubensis TaxID=83656 RepID=UPI0015C3B8AA|nr:HAD family phosphatase [Streptomyces tsukubensis]